MRIKCIICGMMIGAAPLEAATITVTFPPLKAWVEEVAGSGHEIHVLMGAGTDPHHFQLKPKDMVEVSKSEVFLSFGTPDEVQIEKKLSSVMRGATKIHVSPPGEVEDSHYWHRAGVMKECVSALAALQPWSDQPVEAKVEALVKKLDQTDREIREKLAPYQGRRFYVMHPAYGFIEDYGLEQVAIEAGHQAVSPASLVKVLKQMKADGAGMMLMRRGHHPGLRKKIREMGGIRIVDVELLSENYTGLLHEIADAIVADMEQRHE